MTNPTLPPYFGTWDELLQALLHNPFLGSGSGGIPPRTHLEELQATQTNSVNPHSPAASLILSAIGIKQTAGRIAHGKLRNEMISAANQSLADYEDEYCGTPPRPHPWVFVLAIELTSFANTLPQGNLQTEILNVAGQLIQKSFGAGAQKQVGATA
jgi:hypothetical protein